MRRGHAGDQWRRMEGAARRASDRGRRAGGLRVAAEGEIARERADRLRRSGLRAGQRRPEPP